ncbi:hypothetical protein LOZ53_000114 [Ophidiomyces ophidiicola]|nr:hypothetical protein LOZ55_000184 [Ophidiomyces ophidiicola]KAI1992036.1 hypothetical protein LOZ54_001927 [Ophidiomyces ophidiicola]KAI1998328.1 hypothetical protein LOZ53_000114 [Ophidiomyces ophidiicola]KAI2000896.1 hypothetical protein LOZ51_001183 [Ophidiomyces ophidiicola]
MTSQGSRKSVESIKSTSSLPQLPFLQTDPSRSIYRTRHDPRRGSTASSIASSGGASVLTLSNGSIAESGQNAISTLLQPPIIRTGLLPHTSATSTGYKPPSTRDIPPVTLSNIPHVELAPFQAYISQVGSLYESLRHAKEANERGGDSHSFRKNVEAQNSSDLDSIISQQLDRRHSASLYSQPTDGSNRRISSLTNRGRPSTTPLSTIPNIYFDGNFQLENPRTFDIVSERSEVVSPPKPTGATDASVEIPPTKRKALATNAILQEKLSWYLDTVEIHLISSISTASTSFFSALGSLRELHAEAETSVEKIQTLRGDLAKLDDDMALGGLKVVKLRRRRENVEKLANAITQLKEVITSVSQCEQMVEQNDIENAIDELDDVERLVSGKQTMRPRSNLANDGIIDLKAIKALEGASEDLSKLRYRIGMAYETRFLDSLVEDLKTHINAIPPEVTLLRLGDTFVRTRRTNRQFTALPQYMNIDNEMRLRLSRDLAGLGRSRHTMPAATSFKNAILREMKSIIRRHLPSSVDDDADSVMSASTQGGKQLTQQEKSSILARNLRSLDPEDSHSMLTKIYTGISESLRRLSVQVKVLLDITSGLGHSPGLDSARSPSRTPSMARFEDISNPSEAASIAKDEILQVLDMSSLLGQAVDIVQSQIVKVLKVRVEQVELLALPQFLKYFSLNRLFADECEAISGRSGTALKTVVDNQIKVYISSFADRHKHRIIQTMDSDKWDAKDFGDSETVLLGRVLASSTVDVDVWTAASRIWESDGNNTNHAAQTNGSPSNGNETSGKDRVRGALIDEQKYVLPESAILMVKVIEEFQHLMTGIPSMVPDIAVSFLECLKVFNSRLSQLILGAGATKSAGLKNITTKNLALASQALSFVMALIPYVREFIRRHSTSSPLMAEFDKIKRLYQDHQSGIHEKLVDIMSGRAAIQANSMKKIDWEAQKDVNTVSPYMEILVKETGTLHRVLTKHLPDTTVMMIMVPVFSNYRDQWTRAFQSVILHSETARQRILTDIQFLKSKIDRLDGADDLGEHLMHIVKSKSIVSTPVPCASPEPVSKDTPNPKPLEQTEAKQKDSGPQA